MDPQKIDYQKEIDRLWEMANERHHGELKIRPKSNKAWLWKFLNVLLKIVTFGKSMSLYDDFFTTWGRTIYTPGDGKAYESYPLSWKWGMLRHEIAHFDHMYYGIPDLQAKLNLDLAKYGGYTLSKEKGWFHRIWHGFKYLFWPFPFKWAFYRQEVEFWGYIQQIRQSMFEHGEILPGTDKWVHDWFTGSGYGWMATEKKAKDLMIRMRVKVRLEHATRKLSIILFGPAQENESK